MEIVLTKRKVITSLLAVITLAGVALIALKLTGQDLPLAVGFDSGRGAAQAGVEAFYGVNYQDGQDVWAARLCAVTTQPACEYYQKTVAPFLWPDFIASQTVVTVDAGELILLADEPVSTRSNAPASAAASAKESAPAPLARQVWQVAVTLSAPWPQGDGQTSFPAHVLAVREADGWKFERFLLKEELTHYLGGEQ